MNKLETFLRTELMRSSEHFGRCIKDLRKLSQDMPTKDPVKLYAYCSAVRNSDYWLGRMNGCIAAALTVDINLQPLRQQLEEEHGHEEFYYILFTEYSVYNSGWVRIRANSRTQAEIKFYETYDEEYVEKYEAQSMYMELCMSEHDFFLSQYPVYGYLGGYEQDYIN